MRVKPNSFFLWFLSVSLNDAFNFLFISPSLLFLALPKRKEPSPFVATAAFLETHLKEIKCLAVLVLVLVLGVLDLVLDIVLDR